MWTICNLLDSLTVTANFDGTTTHGWHLDVRYEVAKGLIVLQHLHLYTCQNTGTTLEWTFSGVSFLFQNLYL